MHSSQNRNVFLHPSKDKLDWHASNLPIMWLPHPFKTPLTSLFSNLRAKNSHDNHMGHGYRSL